MTQAAILAASGSPGTTTGFKNRIINGAMTIDQRNAGASVTPTDGQYTLDRWCSIMYSSASKYTIQQNAGSVTPPAGFTNYLGITSSSSYSVATGDIYGIHQRIEGFNTADLGWGTANAKTVTLSFWVRSSLTGTFGGSITNSAQDYSYPFSYTISAANTWTQISVTVVGPTSGTWIGATNGIGLQVNFGIGGGSTFSGTAGAWAAQQKYTTTGAVSVVGTSGATFYITGVQLEVGTTATNFDFRSYGTELNLCQRYYEQVTYDLGGAMVTGQAINAGRALANLGWTVQKRAQPTISYSGDIYVWNYLATGYAAGSVTFTDASVNNVRIDCNSVSTNPLTSGNAAMIYPQTDVVLKVSAEL